MSQVESVAIRFVQYGNQQCLTAEQIKEEPWLARFIESFPACFEHDLSRDIWVYIQPPIEK